jgi:hypothetical protein
MNFMKKTLIFTLTLLFSINLYASAVFWARPLAKVLVDEKQTKLYLEYDQILRGSSDPVASSLKDVMDVLGVKSDRDLVKKAESLKNFILKAVKGDKSHIDYQRAVYLVKALKKPAKKFKDSDDALKPINYLIMLTGRYQEKNGIKFSTTCNSLCANQTVNRAEIEQVRVKINIKTVSEAGEDIYGTPNRRYTAVNDYFKSQGWKPLGDIGELEIDEDISWSFLMNLHKSLKNVNTKALPGTLVSKSMTLKDVLEQQTLKEYVDTMVEFSTYKGVVDMSSHFGRFAQQITSGASLADLKSLTKVMKGAIALARKKGEAPSQKFFYDYLDSLAADSPYLKGEVKKLKSREIKSGPNAGKKWSCFFRN